MARVLYEEGALRIEAKLTTRGKEYLEAQVVPHASGRVELTRQQALRIAASIVQWAEGLL